MLALTGCYSVFDPAPYNPSFDAGLLALYSLDRTTLTRFGDLDDATKKLQALGDGYAGARDDLMREELALDIPVLGLAAATVGSSIFRSSKDQVLALGLGSAAMAGARSYLNPQNRVVAYNGAALALSCGAAVSADLAAIHTSLEPSANDTAQQLSDLIAQANATASAPISAPSTPQTRANLLTARDQAQKALDDLHAALGTLQTAVARLQVFAVQTMRNATSKVVTGSQNIDAALAAIRAAAPSSAPAKPPSRQALAVSGYVRGAPGLPPEAALTRDLQEQTVSAQFYTKTINDGWSQLAGCTSS
jgi:hypothetical protein